MARLPRYFIPNVPLHIIQRGNNRQIIFATESDYEFFRECLVEAARKHGLALHAYVFMTNHVHLFATPDQAESVSKTLQSVGRRYVQYFNYQYGRTGTLWEGRYKATAIDSETYLLTCCRYIELNPVRAGMVDHPRDYRWSSYRCNADGEEDALVTAHLLYKQLDRSRQERESAYRALFKAHLDVATLEEIRDTVNKGWALGSDRFKREIESLAQRRATPLPRGRKKADKDGENKQGNLL